MFCRLNQLIVTIFVVTGSIFHVVDAIIFDGVSSLHVWLTVSSLITRDSNNPKSLIFRQIELNWINAPLDHSSDYIGLYLDGEPNERSMPVSIHRLAGQTNGHMMTDFFLPQINFFNETFEDLNRVWKVHNSQLNDSQSSGSNEMNRWNSYPMRRHDKRDSRDSSDSIKTGSSITSTSQCLGYCLAYHSRNKILASNCLKTNPTWMQDSFHYIGPKSLPNLMLPGSHNSATYPKLLDKSALNMLNKYQMNQDEPIFNQLVHGIRYLDLRVGYSKVKQRPEQLWIYHDIFRTDISVEEVLEQVKRFLDLTSHEVIIMDFHRFTVGFQNENQATQRERHSKLIDLIFKKLGPYIVPSYLGQHAPLNELISTGKRLVVGYAARSMILGSNELSILGHLASNDKSINRAKQQVKDIDASRQEEEDIMDTTTTNKATIKQKQSSGDSSDLRRGGTGGFLFNKLKSLKLIGRTFSKRSLNVGRFSFASDVGSPPGISERGSRIRNELDHSFLDPNSSQIVTSTTMGGGTNTNELVSDLQQSLAKVALFFPPVRHLWPDKDSIDGLAQYMNDTTCRKYFGELRSMMVELTPTVFGAISDKYDGNRRLAQQVNRPVTDWIRDRWLHCINIVASDYFLGNDLIQLSIYGNKMRAHQSRNVHILSGGSGGGGDAADEQGHCRSFRKIGHLLDKSKIPVQFTFHRPTTSDRNEMDDQDYNPDADMFARPTSDSRIKDNDIITHTNSDGNRIFLKPVRQQNASSRHHQSTNRDGREKRDSFVENFSEGFSNFFSSFKRLLNL